MKKILIAIAIFLTACNQKVCKPAEVVLVDKFIEKHILLLTPYSWYAVYKDGNGNIYRILVSENEYYDAKIGDKGIIGVWDDNITCQL